jgi:hypothetical protein
MGVRRGRRDRVDWRGEGVDEKGYAATGNAWSKSIRAISARPKSIC